VTIICSHLGYDNVSHCHPPVPRCAIDPFGAGRVVGIDFSYEHADTCVRAIDYDADAAGDADLQRAFSRLTRWHYLVSARPAVRLCFTASMLSVQRGEGIGRVSALWSKVQGLALAPTVSARLCGTAATVDELYRNGRSRQW